MRIEQLEALADQARKRGLQSTIHHTNVASFRRAVKAGVSSLAHMAADEDELLTQEDIDAFLAAGSIIEPTLTTAYALCWKIKGDPYINKEGMRILSDYRESVYTFEDIGNEYYIKELHNSLLQAMKKLSAGKFKMLGLIDLSGLFKLYTRMAVGSFTNFSNLVERSATIALANDGGVSPGTPAMMGPELRFMDLILDKFAKIGKLKGIDAIRIGTLNSAKSLGMDTDFGTIETGKTGDLVIIDGDPLEDASLVGGRASALFMDGELVINNCGLKVEKYA